MKTSLLFVVIFVISIFFSNITMAAEPWPGEPWPDSTVLTHLDSDLQNNLSGAHWNDETQTLWVCLNGPAKFWALVLNAQGSFEVDSQNGKRAEWTSGGDFEGITQVNLDEPFVYIMVEGQDKIKKFDVSVYGSPVLNREWNIAPYVPTSGGSGSEGIAFVPDAWLSLNGFVDSNGEPYVSQNGMGGLMFVAHQNGGSVYVFDLEPDSSRVNFVGAYRTLRSESSGLEFDRSSGKIYIWHNTGGNFIEVSDTSSFVAADGQRYFSSIKEYRGPKGGNLEGIALTPASSENNWFFTTDDNNQNGAALMWFDSFMPKVLGHDQYETYQNMSLNVAAPGVLANDFGADRLVIVEEPMHGTLENLYVNDVFDGSFTYYPNPGYLGPDSLTYRAIDGEEIAQVEIAVKPVKTMTRAITASMDDVEERANGTMYTNSSDLELVNERTLQTVGLRFNTIDIPADARILKASIQFTTDETKSELTDLTIQGDASSDADAFDLSSFNVSERSRTSSQVSWQPEAWTMINEAGLKQQTSDIGSIVQEIIGTDGWQSGNAMAFIITGSGKRVARSYDRSPSLAPKLIIEYVDNEMPSVDPQVSSIDVRISADIDDVEQRANGRMYMNSSDIELITDRSAQTIGLRFRTVDIPQGAEIVGASLQFTVDEASSGATELTFRGEASADAELFTTSYFDVTNRTPTNASVAWTPAAWNLVGESGNDQKTPNLSAIVQEIVDNPDWQANGSMVIMISGSGKRTAESFRGSANSAPLLHVEYR